MVKVSAGDLWLGSVKGKGNKDEHPRTQVKLGSFCFDKTEVTVEQFKSCVDNGVCDAPPTSVELENSKSDKADEKRSALCAGNRKGDPTKMPVSCVSHDDAAKFCKWRGGRLPTEIEFEYVATGGEDETTFPWGNSKPDATKVCFGVTEPCPVASKAQEAFGAFDVAGNLQEWTATGYGPYPTPPDTADPVAVRGVSFSAKPADLVSSKTRYSKPAFVRDIDLGFRCAKSL